MTNDPEERYVIIPPAWEAVRIENDGKLTALVKVTLRDLARFGRDRAWVHYVGSKDRPGVSLWLTQLELTYFPPRTTRNREFVLHNLVWEGLEWAVASIPRKCERFAARVAGRLGMRIADGVPTIFDGSGGPKTFPMSSPGVFTLEYAPDRGIAKVAALPFGLRKLAKLERREVDALRRAHGEAHRHN